MNSDFNSYAEIIELYNKLKNIEYEKINLQLIKWFEANISAVLGGVLDSLSPTNEIQFAGDNNILSILKRNNFLAHYGYESRFDDNNTTVSYLKLEPSESLYFNNYINSELLNRSDLPKMSVKLRKKISEAIYEIFVNAQLHSETKHIYTCGQFFPIKSKLEFTIVDMGIGFDKSINKRFGVNISALEAIRWALKDGNTTKTDAPGGIGLAILKDFIKLNKGRFQIISGTGFYELQNNQCEVFKIFDKPFPGTIVNMEFRTDDDGAYVLSSELINEDDIF